MSYPSLQLLILLQITLSLLTYPSSALRRHHTPEQLNTGAPPTAYFEVTKSIDHPKTNPCSYLLLHHDFGYTYSKPPIFASYTPPDPADCPAKEFSTIVLEWSATCKGRQYDRIFGVWLGGVELLRGCTAEPRLDGIVWKVEKDITRYYSLLMSNQTLVVYLGNIVSSTYTGVYNVDIRIHFFPSENPDLGQDSAIGDRNWADLILPISRELPVNDGLWFEIENSTDIVTKEFVIPANVYKAVLEVYVSFHEDDEGWYSNLPNDYIAANNLSGAYGNGPFREVVVTLDDGVVVGAVWPFTVIYTGGINPLLWRPITGIGSFDLPTYDIELTPLLGKLLDGTKHRMGFGVTNALNVWYVDANLQLWLDKTSSKTVGQVLSYEAPSLQISEVSNFTGLNGTFVTKANRSISSIGWVRSSHGEITTSFTQDFGFVNFMVLGDNANMQIVNQTIHFNTSVSTKTPSSQVRIFQSHKTFPLYWYDAQDYQSDDDYVEVDSVTLGFNEDKIYDDGVGYLTSSLRNLQTAQGYMVVQEDSVVSGLGSTQQLYKYDSTSEPCYSRNVSSSNYTILYDRVTDKCSYKLGGDSSTLFSTFAPDNINMQVLQL